MRVSPGVLLTSYIVVGFVFGQDSMFGDRLRYLDISSSHAFNDVRKRPAHEGACYGECEYDAEGGCCEHLESGPFALKQQIPR